MKEENWYKMFVVALLLHVVLIAAFSVPLRKAARKIDLSYYSVNLVTDVGGPENGAVQGSAPVLPAGKKASPPAPAKKTQPVERAKAKPILQPKEKERSIAPTKATATPPEKAVPPKKEIPQPQTASTDEVKTLDEKIRAMRKRTQYMDVGGNSGEGSTTGTQNTPGTSTGLGSSSGPGGSLEAKYAATVWEKIQDVWSVPSLLASKKDLQSKLTIRVRKDGRIVEWIFDERSSSRVYDESIVRALKSVEKVPPIPDSFNTDVIEISYRVLPPKR
jgi:outer membrane biosynthesis protein TonB